jgi:hypothetical protein
MNMSRLTRSLSRARRHVVCGIGSAVACALLTTGADAQSTTSAEGSAPQAPATPGQAPTVGEQTDLEDLFRRLRKKHRGESPEQQEPKEGERQKGAALVLIPIVSSKPSSGLAVGLGGSIEFTLGALTDTFVSSVLLGASISTKTQTTAFGKPDLFGSRNQWILTGDNHFKFAGQTTYGLGGDAPAANATDMSYLSVRFIDVYYWKVAGNLSVGAGPSYQRFSHIAPDGGGGWAGTPYGDYALAKGLDPAAQTAAGLLVSARSDTRDNRSDPSRGWSMETRYTAQFAGFLGGDSTWQRLYGDVRGYVPVTRDRRHKLALWLYGDFVTHGTAPYLALPATGADPSERSGRGYAEGRFRGEQLVYAEVEYRATLTRNGLIGMVGFLNATTVGSAFVHEPLFDHASIGGGVGLRVRLQKRSRTNLCLDYGIGQLGSRAIYFAIGEAF